MNMGESVIRAGKASKQSPDKCTSPSSPILQESKFKLSNFVNPDKVFNQVISQTHGK